MGTRSRLALFVALIVGGLLAAPSRAQIVDDPEPIGGKFVFRTAPVEVLKERGSVSVLDYSGEQATPEEIRSSAAHYDVLIWQRLVAFGTCDDLIDCTKECNSTCEDVYGSKAKKSEIKDNPDGSTSCQCSCNDIGVVTIECVTPEIRLKPNSINDNPDPVGWKLELPVKRQ